MFQPLESVGENKTSTSTCAMVTNTKLAKKVEDQEEENRLLRERLTQLELKVDEVDVKAEEEKEMIEGKKKEIPLDDEVPKLDPVLVEEPFLKALKALSGKALEGIPIFNGK